MGVEGYPNEACMARRLSIAELWICKGRPTHEHANIAHGREPQRKHRSNCEPVLSNRCLHDSLAMTAIIEVWEAYSLTTLAHFVSISHLLLIKYSPCRRYADPSAQHDFLQKWGRLLNGIHFTPTIQSLCAFHVEGKAAYERFQQGMLHGVNKLFNVSVGTWNAKRALKVWSAS